MPFTQEDFNNAITDLGQCEDPITLRSMLVNLTNNVSELFQVNEDLSKANEDLTKKYREAQDHNMELFLQVNAQKSAVESEPPAEPPKEPRKFADLFDEKGNIK